MQRKKIMAKKNQKREIVKDKLDILLVSETKVDNLSPQANLR